ncbi:MAG: two-component system activity regulator YycH, partial [Bombilactobacillus mellifer]|nr:two-component system activity regulator YycH [Bombilactobacillus mellifer]
NHVPNGLTSLLKTSKDTMQKIDNSFNSFRYFAKTGKKHVVFRSYIDGFPVFYNEQKGDVSLLWQKNSQSFYFSNTTLEVPISTSQNSVTIETTNSLLQRLKNKGIKIRDIQDIQLGYSWVKNNDSVEVINLLPGYFIKIGGIYRDAATIINHQGGDNS